MLRMILEHGRRLVVRLWHAACLLYWSSPLAPLFIGEVSMDDLTASLVKCREEFESRRSSPCFKPEWEHALVQLEWEHVRRLEGAGRHEDPFVQAVYGRARGR